MIPRHLKKKINKYICDHLYPRNWNSRKNRIDSLNRLLGYTDCLVEHNMINEEEYLKLRAKICLSYPDKLLNFSL